MLEILTVKEIADYLRVNAKTIYALIIEGKLGCVRVGRAIRIPRKALQEFLETYGGAQGQDAVLPSSSCKSA